MRKYLLPEVGNFYKANLHSHSTLSDGSFTVAGMKEEYKKRGYSILATSDHDALHSNYSLSEPDFLILTAYEISIRSDDTLTPHSLRKIVDLNLFAKTPDNLTQCGYHPDTVEWLVRRGKLSREDVDSIKYAGELRDLHYYPANINKIIRTASENGFLVSINHPEWDNINYSDYGMFEGAFAVEVYNHGSYVSDGLHDSEAVFEDILKSGRKIFALATDDNHNHQPDDGPRCDSFGGSTVLLAPDLSYESLIKALETGNFYAVSGSSTHFGADIRSIVYEDGKVTLAMGNETHTFEKSEVAMVRLRVEF